MYEYPTDMKSENYLAKKGDFLLAAALREFRQNDPQKATQEEMSRYFSVSLSTYRNWESGRSKPTRENEKKIKNLLDPYSRNNLYR